MKELFKFKLNIRALLDFTIFFTIFFLFRIHYILDFLNPYINKKIKNYIDLVTDSNVFLTVKKKISLNKLKEKSEKLNEHNLDLRKRIFNVFYVFIGILLTINVSMFIFDHKTYIKKIKISKYLIFKLIINALFFATIIFSFTINATVPYYEQIILKNVNKYFKTVDIDINNLLQIKAES